MNRPRGDHPRDRVRPNAAATNATPAATRCISPPRGRDRLAAAEKTTEQAMTELLAPLPPRARRQPNELLIRFIEHTAEAE